MMRPYKIAGRETTRHQKDADFRFVTICGQNELSSDFWPLFATQKAPICYYFIFVAKMNFPAIFEHFSPPKRRRCVTICCQNENFENFRGSQKTKIWIWTPNEFFSKKGKGYDVRRWWIYRLEVLNVWVDGWFFWWNRQKLFFGPKIPPRCVFRVYICEKRTFRCQFWAQN